MEFPVIGFVLRTALVWQELASFCAVRVRHRSAALAGGFWATGDASLANWLRFVTCAHRFDP